MTKTAKGLLGLAVGCLVAGGMINLGWIHAGNIDALYVLLPLGAVFLGLFLIVRVLGNESKLHDRDQHAAGSANAPSESPEHRPS